MENFQGVIGWNMILSNQNELLFPINIYNYALITTFFNIAKDTNYFTKKFTN